MTVKELLEWTRLRVQFFTVLVDAVILLAGCGIRITANLLTFYAWVELVTAVLCSIRTIATTFAENLVSLGHKALEGCMSLLPPYD